MSGSAWMTGEEACSDAGSEAGRPSETTDSAMSRSVINPTGPPRESTSTTDPTPRSRISAATSWTETSGLAVTTDCVITSLTSTSGESRGAGPADAPTRSPPGRRAPEDYHRRGVPYRSPSQVARMRRIESLIRAAAPVLDVVLYAGDRASKLIGRNEIGPEPARRP